jgi:hypothetical protein
VGCDGFPGACATDGTGMLGTSVSSTSVTVSTTLSEEGLEVVVCAIWDSGFGDASGDRGGVCDTTGEARYGDSEPLVGAGATTFSRPVATAFLTMSGTRVNGDGSWIGVVVGWRFGDCSGVGFANGNGSVSSRNRRCLTEEVTGQQVAPRLEEQ